MSRRSRAERREVNADPNFGSTTVQRFVNNLMVDGKKSVAERIFSQALEIIEENSGQPGLKRLPTSGQ